MKNILFCLLMAVFAAGISVAKDGAVSNEPAAPQQEPERGEGQGGRGRQEKVPRDEVDWREEARLRYEKIDRLAKAARKETDEVKKEALVEELRSVLMEGAEGMLEHFRKRLENAEEDVAQMRARLEEGEANMEARVEEQLCQLLAVERPPRKRNGEQDGSRGRPRGGGPAPDEEASSDGEAPSGEDAPSPEPPPMAE